MWVYIYNVNGIHEHIQIDSLKTVQEVDREIERTNERLPNYKRNLLWVIPCGSIIFWYLTFKITTDQGGILSSSATKFVLIGWTIWIGACIFKILRTKDSTAIRIRELKLRKHMLEKGNTL